MAKKKSNEGIVSKYAPKLISYFFSMPEDNRQSLMRRLNDVVHIKRNILRYVTVLIVTLASLVIILDGSGILLGWLLPGMPPGVSHIIIGAIIIALTAIYLKTTS